MTTSLGTDTTLVSIRRQHHLAQNPMLGLATFVCLAVISAATATPSANGVNHGFNWERTKYMYAFGDSYTFVQGTRGLANFRCAPAVSNIEMTTI